MANTSKCMSRHMQQMSCHVLDIDPHGKCLQCFGRLQCLLQEGTSCNVGIISLRAGNNRLSLKQMNSQVMCQKMEGIQEYGAVDELKRFLAQRRQLVLGDVCVVPRVANHKCLCCKGYHVCILHTSNCLDNHIFKPWATVIVLPAFITHAQSVILHLPMIA
jgi:hypothetical protein